MRVAVLLTIAAGIVVSAAPAQARGDKHSGRPTPGVPVTYTTKYRGGYDNMLLKFSSEKKRRPLFISGRGRQSKLTIAFRDLGAMQGFAENPEMIDVLEAYVASGEVEGDGKHWTASRYGTDDYTCGPWMEREKRPQLTLRISDLKQWKPYKDRRGRVQKESFTVNAKCEVQADEQVAAGRAEMKLTFADRGGISFSGTFTIQGKDLGFTDEDAGEIKVRFRLSGWTRYSGAVQEEFDKSLEEGVEVDDSLKVDELPTFD